MFRGAPRVPGSSHGVLKAAAAIGTGEVKTDVPPPCACRPKIPMKKEYDTLEFHVFGGIIRAC